MKAKSITFKAYIPPLQTAIMVDGLGDVMQVKLNIPIRESPSGLLLQTMTQMQLLITVQAIEPKPEPKKKAPKDKAKTARHFSMYKGRKQ